MGRLSVLRTHVNCELEMIPDPKIRTGAAAHRKQTAKLNFVFALANRILADRPWLAAHGIISAADYSNLQNCRQRSVN